MKKDKKVYFEYELLNSILLYAEINHLTFSKAVDKLCNIGLSLNEKDNYVKEISKSVNDCKWNFLYIKSFLKQIYSDLNLPFNDIKNSKNLKKFESLYKERKMDD